MTKFSPNQWMVLGQLGDKAVIEAGRGSVYLKADGGDGDDAIAMLSPDAADELAAHLIQAAQMARNKAAK